jgi:hypothetical protein
VGATAFLSSKDLAPVIVEQPKSDSSPGVRAASRIAVEMSEARTSTSAKIKGARHY